MWKAGGTETTASFKDLAAENKILRERIAALEKDHEELLSLNIELQEQLEKEKATSLELAQEVLTVKKAQLANVTEEESHLNDQRAVLDLLQGQLRCFAGLAAESEAASKEAKEQKDAAAPGTGRSPGHAA